MEAIRTYIDNVFKAFPPGERLNVLKRDMLAGMEEKYHALKGEGKSENEAVGSVIADFGSMDEIAAELGIQPGSAEPAVPENGISLSNEEARDYINQTRKSSLWIGLGVWLILAGVAAMVLIGKLISDYDGALIIGPIVIAGPQEMTASLGLGIFVLFFAIAAAVALFVIHGMRLSRFEKYETTPILLDHSTRSEFEDERKNFQSKFAVLLTAGIAVILLAVGGLVLLGTLSGFENGSVAAFLFAIGFAVFLIVHAGMQYGAYDVLLGVGDYENKMGSVEYEKYERLIGTVAAVFWPLVTAVYLAWSFIGNSWNISWIVWPIAGVLFGAFAGGISVWYTTSKNR